MKATFAQLAREHGLRARETAVPFVDPPGLMGGFVLSVGEMDMHVGVVVAPGKNTVGITTYLFAPVIVDIPDRPEVRGLSLPAGGGTLTVDRFDGLVEELQAPGTIQAAIICPMESSKAISEENWATYFQSLNRAALEVARAAHHIVGNVVANVGGRPLIQSLTPEAATPEAATPPETQETQESLPPDRPRNRVTGHVHWVPYSLLLIWGAIASRPNAQRREPTGELSVSDFAIQNGQIVSTRSFEPSLPNWVFVTFFLCIALAAFLAYVRYRKTMSVSEIGGTSYPAEFAYCLALPGRIVGLGVTKLLGLMIPKLAIFSAAAAATGALMAWDSLPKTNFTASGKKWGNQYSKSAGFNDAALVGGLIVAVLAAALVYSELRGLLMPLTSPAWWLLHTIGSADPNWFLCLALGVIMVGIPLMIDTQVDRDVKAAESK